MKLKTGLDPTERVHVKDSRGLRFCGMGAFVGVGRDAACARLHGGDRSPSTPRPTSRSIPSDWRTSSRSTCAQSTAAASG